MRQKFWWKWFLKAVFPGDPHKAEGGFGRTEQAKEEGKPGGALRQNPSLCPFLQGAVESNYSSELSPTTSTLLALTGFRPSLWMETLTRYLAPRTGRVKPVSSPAPGSTVSSKGIRRLGQESTETRRRMGGQLGRAQTGLLPTPYKV